MTLQIAQSDQFEHVVSLLTLAFADDPVGRAGWGDMIDLKMHCDSNGEGSTHQPQYVSRA